MESPYAVPFAVPMARTPVCKEVRSTLLVASIRSLKQHGLFDRYCAELDDSVREELLLAPPAVWLPISLADAHYAACDRLRLPQEQILLIGNEVGRVTQRSGMSIVLRVANESGVTPWTVFANAQRFWGRLYQGSAMAVTKEGPKDARFLAVGTPLARYNYWRVGLRGIIAAVGEPFCSKIVVRHDDPPMSADCSVAFRVSWV